MTRTIILSYHGVGLESLQEDDFFLRIWFSPEYEIFKDGSVYSYKKNKFRKLTLNKGNGYLHVTLSCPDNITRNVMVHRLVATHFIDNPENKPQVNHKNGDKLDNRVENLEWVTDSENKFHCYRTGLKDVNVRSIRVAQLELSSGKLIKIHDSANSASREVGVGQGNITNCCKGRCKSVGGFAWKYEVDLK